MKQSEPLPPAICFVPREICVEYEGDEPLVINEESKEDAKVVEKLFGGKIKLICLGRPTFTSDGGWLRVVSPCTGWVCLQPSRKQLKGKVRLCGTDGDELVDWLKVVERMCSLQIVKGPALSNNFDDEEMAALRNPPPGWNLAADEELAQFLSQNGANLRSQGTGGDGMAYFTKVEASSAEEETKNLFDSNPETYWESDGNQGEHWLRFHVKPGTIIERLLLIVDPEDSSYLPKRVIVKGGSPGNMTTLHSLTLGEAEYDTKELNILPRPLVMYLEILELYIKSCHQGGIDTRIRGVKVTTHTSELLFPESDMLAGDIFSQEKIARYPKLQAFQPKQLFSRALVLKRVAHLIDQDLTYLLPRWNLGAGAFGEVETIRQMWPLSQKRGAIIQEMLSKTISSVPSSRPPVYINRLAARAHREDTSRDPECKNTVFKQLQRELKKSTKPSSYNFRWAGQWTQWWECKFVQEGVIDQGGAFRDSVSDLADELCPSDPTSEVALPLFVRSPNQSQDSSNAYRDAYTPNPGCQLLEDYQFVGKLMGAMYRSSERLAMSLPQFFWKKLIQEPVTWARDFISVDSAEVKLVDSIETMSRIDFDASFAGMLHYNVVLSNGETVPLVPNGDERPVTYDERLEYCRLVKEKRMGEGEVQIEAIRQGLTKVVPADVLSLLTWQELELKVCGSPEITIEALKKAVRYNNSSFNESNPQVQMMWKALEQFSNGDRSQFLRFITGRRRLPCTIYVESCDNGSLPTSSTCSNTLHLPKYSSVEQAVDRLRYAAYNCVAIDTDMSRSPWE